MSVRNNKKKNISNKIHFVLMPLLSIFVIVLLAINLGASNSNSEEKFNIVFDDEYTYISLIESSFSKTNISLKDSKALQDEDSDFPMQVYKVKQNENFSTIAKKLHTNLSTIYSINGIEQDGNVVHPGQKFLVLPGKKGLLHKVKKGETLEKIADLYESCGGASLDEILDENDISSNDTIKAGEKIFIPGASFSGNEIIQRSNPKWMLPIEKGSYVTSEYSPERTIWIKGKKYSGPHKGIDIGNKKRTKTKVYASRKGVVSFVGYKTGYGRVVYINHGKGYETRYAHLSKYIVKKGQKVKQGQYIARVGNSGRSTGPHLHFEIRYKGSPKNPRNYVPALNKLRKK